MDSASSQNDALAEAHMLEIFGPATKTNGEMLNQRKCKSLNRRDRNKFQSTHQL